MIRFGDHKSQKDHISLPNPYSQEITDFSENLEVTTSEVPDELTEPLPLDKVPFDFIETEEALGELVKYLV